MQLFKKQQEYDPFDDIPNNNTNENSVVYQWDRININNIYPSKDNVYPIKDIEELAKSIATVGLEQNLVVKETNNTNQDGEQQYELITGHRRLEAIKYILNNLNDNRFEGMMDRVKNEITNPMCRIIPFEENSNTTTDDEELKKKLRIDESNINIRTMDDAELTIVIENYLNNVAEAKARHLKINGVEYTGTTRELLQKKFEFSSGKAQRVLSVIHSDEETKEKVKSGELSLNQAYERKHNKTKAPTQFADVEDFMKNRLSTKVSFSKNKFTVQFKDEADLKRILEMLNIKMENS